MTDTRAIAERYARVAGSLDERGRRAVAAPEALAVGRGGITKVAQASGLSRKAIARGIRELRGEVPVAAPGRVRRPGGGRKDHGDTRPHPARRSGAVGRAAHARRSRRAAALDVQEPAPAGARAAAAGPSGQPSEGGERAA